MDYYSCKICGSNKIINAVDRDNRILLCQSCGVGFLNPKLFNYDRPSYYAGASNYYAVANNDQRLEAITNNAIDQVNIIKKWVNLPRGALLDVGAHTGTFVKEASMRGFRAEGIEPNKYIVEWAQKNGINLYNTDINSYTPDKKYDIVTIFHVLEHLSDPVGAIVKIKQWLNHGGYLVVEVPNFTSYLARLDGLSWKYVAPEHLYYFSEKSLSRIISSLGFNILMSKKRNHEMRYLNFRKILRYILGGKITRDRLVEKKEKYYGPIVYKRKRSIGGAASFLATKIIKLLGREDHILIVACNSRSVAEAI